MSNGSELSNSLVLTSTANGGWDDQYVGVLAPLSRRLRRCYTSRSWLQILELVMYTLFTVLGSPVSVPRTDLRQTLSLFASSSSERRMYTGTALGNRSAFRFVIYTNGFVDEMHAKASVTTSQTWNNNTPNIREAPNQRKTDQTNRLTHVFFVFFSSSCWHQLTVRKDTWWSMQCIIGVLCHKEWL